MTDFEKMKSLLDEWGVEYDIHDGKDYNTIILTANSKGVAGFSGFCTAILFTKDGKFDAFDIYED